MTPLRAWAIDRVRTRLLAAFLILLVAAIALAAVGWFGMRSAQRAVAGFEDDLLPNISHAMELAERTTQLAAVAPKLADSATEEAFNENTRAVLDLLEQIRQQSGTVSASTEFGATLSRLQDEVRRDLNFLIVLTREKLQLQRRFADQLKQRGLIVLDNTLWRGRVADPHDQSRQADTLRRLNQAIHDDPDLALVLLPVGDGLTLLRRRR